MITQGLAAQAAMFLAILLLATAFHKVKRWHTARISAGELLGLSKHLTLAAAAGAVAVEVLAAILLFVPAYRLTGVLMTVVMWSGYTVLLVRARAQGRSIDCGCSFGEARHTLGLFEIHRNLVLIVLAMLVAWSCASCGSIPATPSQMIAACAMLALYAAIDQVLALPPLRSGELL
jgi:hypothetical protein